MRTTYKVMLNGKRIGFAKDAETAKIIMKLAKAGFKNGAPTSKD